MPDCSYEEKTINLDIFTKISFYIKIYFIDKKEFYSLKFEKKLYFLKFWKNECFCDSYPDRHYKL